MRICTKQKAGMHISKGKHLIFLFEAGLKAKGTRAKSV